MDWVTLLQGLLQEVILKHPAPWDYQSTLFLHPSSPPKAFSPTGTQDRIISTLWLFPPFPQFPLPASGWPFLNSLFFSLPSPYSCLQLKLYNPVFYAWPVDVSKHIFEISEKIFCLSCVSLLYLKGRGFHVNCEPTELKKVIV